MNRSSLHMTIGDEMNDRITAYDENCTIGERIDEIVATGKDVHMEMLDETTAFMQIGDERFAIFVKKRKLVIAWRETLCRR